MFLKMICCCTQLNIEHLETHCCSIEIQKLIEFAAYEIIQIGHNLGIDRVTRVLF